MQTAFVIETNAPTITITAPTKQSNTAITSTTVTIFDDTRIDANDVSITTTNQTGGFSISNVSCTQTNATRVDCTLQIDGNDGTGDIRVTATDVAGNESNRSEVGYQIDTTPPATPSCSSTPNPAANGASVTTTCTGVEEAAIVEIINMTCSPSPADATGTVTCTGTVGNGPTDISTPDDVVSVTDAFSNSNHSETTGLEVDSTPPADPLSAPDMTESSDRGTSSTDNITNDTRPYFTLRCTEVGTTLRLYIDGVFSASASCSSIGDMTIQPATELANGTFTATYNEVDSLGNQSSVSPGLEFTIFRSSTTLTVDTPKSNGVITGTTTPGNTVTLTSGGSTCTTTADASGAFSCTLSPVPTTSTNVTVTSTDLAGNVASELVLFEVAGTPLPTAPMTGFTKSPLPWLLLIVGVCAAFLLVAAYRKKRYAQETF